MVEVKIKIDGGIEPTYANDSDAGVDLFAKEDIVVPAGAKGFLIKTGISLELPEMYELQVRPKSGNSIKTPIRVILGTVDCGYRGEIGIIVDNISSEDYLISKDKAIAQGVLNCVPRMKFNAVEELSNSHRGKGGFGSTGRGI